MEKGNKQTARNLVESVRILFLINYTINTSNNTTLRVFSLTGFYQNQADSTIKIL